MNLSQLRPELPSWMFLLSSHPVKIKNLPPNGLLA